MGIVKVSSKRIYVMLIHI